MALMSHSNIKFISNLSFVVKRSLWQMTGIRKSSDAILQGSLTLLMTYNLSFFFFLLF